MAANKTSEVIRQIGIVRKSDGRLGGEEESSTQARSTRSSLVDYNLGGRRNATAAGRRRDRAIRLLHEPVVHVLQNAVALDGRARSHIRKVSVIRACRKSACGRPTFSSYLSPSPPQA